MSDFVLGLDIGGTNCRIGCVSEDFTLNGFEIAKSKEIFAEPSLKGLVRFIDGFLQKYGKPQAICVGFPAAISRDRATILQAPNIKGLDGLNVKSILETAFPFPVYLERDVNLLLLNDMRLLQIHAAETVLGCYIGTGLGNGIYMNGKLLIGKNGVAGELGHVPLFSENVCGCGNTGCAETRASGIGLENLRNKFYRDTPVGELFTRYGKSSLIQDYLDDLSRPIATEVNIFDPDYVVLGGGVVVMKDFPRELFEKLILSHTRKPFPHDNLQIRYSQAAQESGVVGAGLYAYKILKGECI